MKISIKKILTLLLLAFAFSTFSQDIKATLADHELIGKVKGVTTSIYVVDGTTQSLDETIELVFNDSGNLTKEVDQFWVTEYFYTTEGLVDYMISNHKAGDNNAKITYEYNAEKQIVKQTSDSSYFGHGGETYTYNESGQLISVVTESDESEENGTNLFSYDASGRKIEEKVYYGNEWERTTTFSYPEKNVIKTQTEMPSFAIPGETQIAGIATEVRNEQGLLIKEEQSQYITLYSYKFDNKGNWIEKIRTITDKDGAELERGMVKREIQYYE